MILMPPRIIARRTAPDKDKWYRKTPFPGDEGPHISHANIARFVCLCYGELADDGEGIKGAKIMRGSTTARPMTMAADGPDARLFERAMRRAIEAVSADGGSIATLDETRSAMVLRVRQIHPRLNVEPMRALPASRDDIGEANTTVLPTAHLWRLYRTGERLIGTTWLTGKSVILSGDEVLGLPSSSTAPEDPIAASHMAVPIFAPLPEDAAAISEEPVIIGVITVYVADPRWRFTQNQLIMLESQAANIAQSLQLAQLTRQEQSHRRLLALLQELTGDVPFSPGSEEFYERFFDRVYTAIGGVLDVEAFAGVVSNADKPLGFYAVREQGYALPSQRIPDERVPWWSWVRHGRSIVWITDNDRRGAPQLRLREWGSEHYMESQIYVPLKTASGVVGALAVASSRTNAYSMEHVALLEMAGRFVGLAIENTQLRTNTGTAGQSAATERALSLLINALLGLNATLDVSVIIRDLVEQASDLARGQVCVYLEHDRNANELIIRDIAQNKEHPYPEAIGQHIPVGEGRLANSVEGQVQRLEQLESDYERTDIIGAMLKRYQAQAMLLLPVIYTESVTNRDRIIGLMALFSPGQRGLFAPAEEMNLMALGRVAASAINNAHTFTQLRELDRLKDEFILTASHEFRTPMSAIQGFSWLIQRRGETMTPEQGKHWAGEIIRATEQLRDMMDTITESWRTKSVQMPPPQPVQLLTTMQMALEILSSLLAAENHNLQMQVADDLWVMGDQDRLRHVFSNLIGNAAKYSPEGSTISVTSSVKSGAELAALPRERGTRDEEEEQVAPVTPTSGPWVVVSVRDEGRGISTTNQRRLFAKFVRLELTTSVRGTGLGLYICRRYIEAMGGEIWVESVPGQGATFSFCLPQVAAPAN